MALGDVLCEDGRAETVGCIVCALDGFLLGLEGGDDDEGAEDLLAVDLHGVFYVREDRGGDEEPLASDILERLTARYQRRALGLPGLDVREHALELRLRDLWALECVVFEWVPHYRGLLHVRLELLHKLIVHTLLYQDSRCGGADLALVVHDTDVRPFHCLVKLCVVEDYEGGFAACFEGYVFCGWVSIQDL